MILQRGELETVCGQDVFLAALDHGCTAGRARIIGPLHRHDREHDLIEARAEHCEQHQRDEKAGKCQLDVGKTHQQRILPTTEMCSQQPNCRAETKGDQRADTGNAEADPQPVEDGAINVAPLVVRPEPMMGAGGPDATGRQLGIGNAQLGKVEWVLYCQMRGQQGADHGDKHDAESQNGTWRIQNFRQTSRHLNSLRTLRRADR